MADVQASTSETVNVSSFSSESSNDDEKLRKLLKPAPTLDDVRNILIRYYYDSDDPEAFVHIIKQLDSYDDCNYQVMIGDEMYLLKITNGLESRDYINSTVALSSSSQSIIEFQHSIMNALHENHIGTTVPVKPVRYDTFTSLESKSKTRKRPIDTAHAESTATNTFVNSSRYRNGDVILHMLPVVSESHSPTYLAVRLYKWLSGQPMATIPYHRISLHTMVNVGQQLGCIHHVFDKQLSTTSSSSSSSTVMTTISTSNGDDAQQQQVQSSQITSLLQLPQHRYHQWDTKNTYDLLSFTQYIPDAQRRSMIESIIHTFHTEILTKACSCSSSSSNGDGDDGDPSSPTTTVASKFRRGIIMGDYNDANIILHCDSLQFNGVIDFGDSLER